jgi:hypothetical protein
LRSERGDQVRDRQVRDELTEQRAQLYNQRAYRSLSELASRQRLAHQALLATKTFRYMSALRNA